jgi:hypothetical protein
MIEHRTDNDSRTQMRRGPGERLKATRVKAGHDLDWVAAQLRLRKLVIEALESNSYENLPPPVFVQGYLRSYADILGLPQAEVVKAYHEATDAKKPEGNPLLPKKQERPRPSPKKPPLAKGSTPPPPQAPSAKGRDRLAGKSAPQIAVARDTAAGGAQPEKTPVLPIARAVPGADAPAGLVGGKAAPLVPGEKPSADKKRFDALNRGPRFKPPGSTPQLRLPKISLPASHVLARRAFKLVLLVLILLVFNWGLAQLGKIRIRSPEAVMDNLQRKWSSLFGGGGQSTEAPVPAREGAPAALPLVAPPMQPLSRDSVLLDAPNLTDSLPEPELEAVVPLESPVTEAPLATEPKRIELELLGNSWVEIDDASGEFRLVGELKKGARYELKGEPPYRVLFGRSNMVKLSVDGQPFDFSALKRGSVARFSLDP